MPRLTPQEIAALHALTERIRTVRVDGQCAVDGLVPGIREFIGCDVLLLFTPVERLVGWGLERVHVDGVPNPAKLTQRIAYFLETSSYRFWAFDPVVPEEAQRDEPIEASALDADELASCDFTRNVLVPARLDRVPFVRALMCDGRALIGCMVAFHAAPITPEMRARFAAVMPVIKHRLSIERLIRSHPATPMLGLVLDQLGGPTYLLGERGEILLANRAGRSLLDDDRASTIHALGDALLGRDDGRVAEAVALPSAAPPATLVTLRHRTIEQRIDGHVDRAVERWQLTARQRDVLRLVIRGFGNAAIAATLGIGERAVELHVSGILDRAGLSRRTSLMSRIFTA